MAAPKEPPKKEALKDFLRQYCEMKPITTGASVSKDKCYVFTTRDCKLFMAEAYVQGIRNAIGQTEEVMAEARRSSDYCGVIMSYNWSAPSPGMDVVQIPEKLVESLSNEQAAVVLRNLQGILKDVEDGKVRKAAVEKLFSDTAVVKTTYALDGERQFLISGKASASDRRRYAERYAELVATSALFNLAKALNAQVNTLLPKPAQGKFFIESRKMASQKIRYGTDANSELLLKDEGALIYAEILKTDPRLGTAIGKLFQQAITDPFGLSLKHYMGKHAVVKLKPDAKE
jgi:hypothetical protein